MPDKKTDAEAEDALRRMGQKIREGFAEQNKPGLEQSLETVRDTVREQWEEKQKALRESATTPEQTKDRQQQPPEQERE